MQAREIQANRMRPVCAKCGSAAIVSDTVKTEFDGVVDFLRCINCGQTSERPGAFIAALAPARKSEPAIPPRRAASAAGVVAVTAGISAEEAPAPAAVRIEVWFDVPFDQAADALDQLLAGKLPARGDTSRCAVRTVRAAAHR